MSVKIPMLVFTCWCIACLKEFPVIYNESPLYSDSNLNNKRNNLFLFKSNLLLYC